MTLEGQPAPEDRASAVPPDATDPGRGASDGDAAAAVPPENVDPGHEAAAAPRSRSATAVIALLVMLLGFALVVQVRSRGNDAGLSAARPEDLVRILSDLDGQQTRLRTEINDLDTTERQLSSGAQGQDAALAEARRRADALGILAGTLPAVGPGLVIMLTPGTDPVTAATVLDAVEELRGAGAEAMQIGPGAGASQIGPGAGASQIGPGAGASQIGPGAEASPTGAVRIVASTSFVDAAGGISSDGVPLRAPYTVTVIGDPQTMLTALNIPGGVVDSVRQHGGTVSVREADQVTVAALHTSTGLTYARPVS